MPSMDIPYPLDENQRLPVCRFQLIWKVQADDAYQVVKQQGFQNPGLFITFGGKGRIAWADRQEELPAGTFLVVDSDIPCSYGCVGGDWKFYYVEFNGLEMVRELGLSVDRAATSARITEAVVLCERLIDSLIMQPVGYGYTAQLVLHELLLLFACEREAGNKVRDPELDEIIYRMHKSIGRLLRINDLIRHSGLSRTAFFTRFREMTGMSPSRYMQELKLASAKASLETTRLSVKEIASKLQFYDEFHFSKMFKQRYGLSPTEYRRLPSSDKPD